MKASGVEPVYLVVGLPDQMVGRRRANDRLAHPTHRNAPAAEVVS